MGTIPNLAARVALAAIVIAAPATVRGQAATIDKAAFDGRWQIDPALTHMGRYGPAGTNMVRSPTFTFIFTPAGENLDVNVYAQYPQPKPTRTMALIPDGRPHRCTDPAACLTAGGDPADQSYVYRVIAPRFVVRMFYDKGVLTEYSTYGVSTDGKTFTMIAWSPETPQWQNVQVFHRQP